MLQETRPELADQSDKPGPALRTPRPSSLHAVQNPASKYRQSHTSVAGRALGQANRHVVEIPSLAADNPAGRTSAGTDWKRSSPLRARCVENLTVVSATLPQLGMGTDSAAQQWGADTQVRPDQCGKPLITRNYATTSYRAAVQCRPDPSPRPARSSGTGTPPGSWPRCPIRLTYQNLGSAPHEAA